MFIKTVIGDVVAHLKTTKIHRFVRFVTCCFITAVCVVMVDVRLTQLMCDKSLQLATMNCPVCWKVSNIFVREYRLSVICVGIL